VRTFPDFPLFVASSFRSVVSRDRTTNCTWELTYRCNARCGFCSYWRNPTDPDEELRLEEVKLGLDAIHRYGCRLVHFSGGEPTLRSDLEDVLSHAAKKRIWTSLVTNGSRLDRERIRGLRRAGLDNLFVSLDFIDREAHDRQRGINGLFDRVLAGLEYLGTDFIGGHRTAGIMCVVSDFNLDSAAKLAGLAKKKGVFITYQLYHPQKAEYDEFRIKNIGKIASELIRLKSANWNVISSKSYISGMKHYQKRNRTCSAGRKYFSIDPMGFLHPCVDLPRAGHILKDPVSVIRSGQALSDVRKCKGCWYSFRGEADHALSIQGSFEKIAQFARIIAKNR